jgi:F0F1-type ATP synthase alpha subunit
LAGPKVGEDLGTRIVAIEILDRIVPVFAQPVAVVASQTVLRAEPEEALIVFDDMTDSAMGGALAEG